MLGIDYGTKNVGLACTDELALTVRPLPSIPNRGRRDLMTRLGTLASRHQVVRVVLGIPWNMDGSAGRAVERAEEFAEALHGALALPVERVDERLSTEEALAIWRAMKPKQKRRYGTVDSLAAALILDRYLRER